MHCPKCGCKYQDGFKICNDCNIALENNKPKFIVEEEKNVDSFTRLLASLLDLLIICGVIGALYYLNNFFVKFELDEVTTYQIIFLFLSLWLYNALFESSKFKGTIGKIICKTCVVDKNCNRISFSRATVRFILRAILGLSIIKQMFSHTGSRNFWYDSISDTRIVYKK
ncbi:RDD family protein [Pseudobacteroides cellulosolvens]|uniref:RDD domain containing protein n=1 Tax=Pseudobacteroides cellulosolvens ATCC 35603 = DSM 2933 TaxID=398512 RepID=A0A0L6JUE5_9FIRM|nr:RDD family protein [Pseudobacteroides cellulosolvens]KNY29443.1 RDD domain containing protein [Pseudobacteroides cellulosolvens ATCC 35603 = DSM 2933]